MLDAIKESSRRTYMAGVGLALMALTAYQAFVATSAHAAVDFEAKDVVTPVESKLDEALPLVIGIIVVMIAFGLVVALVRRHVGKGR